MNRLEKAIYFATKAHSGQKRKFDGVDVIFHPFSVAMILKNINCTEDVVIAGLLHDVIEDTSYKDEDIEKEFGKVVLKLVKGASEPDKTKSWEDRKLHTLEYIKNATLDEKLIVCADKISNVSSLKKDLEEKGEEIWSKLNRGKDKQKWYYTEIYKSLINNAEENHELFVRYKNLLENTFTEERGF